MKRVEWVIVLALTLITGFTLSFAPPPEPREAAELATSAGGTSALLVTATAITQPSPANEAQAATAMPMPTELTRPVLPATSTLEPTVSPTRHQETATPTASPTVLPSPTPFPFDTHPEYPQYIYIDQATQHMYIFERGKLVRDIPCSTGLPDGDKYTPAWSGEVGEYWGTFFAFDVYADEAWYLFKSAGSILVHSLPYTWQNGYKVYQGRDALGVHPASHGCVRISPEDAAWFTVWEPQGVPITVTDPYRHKWR